MRGPNIETTPEHGGALIEAALVLSLFTMIMFGGWKMMQTVALRSQIYNILSASGQVFGADARTDYAALGNDGGCSSWDNNRYCASLRKIFEESHLPLCAITVQFSEFPIEQLLNGNTDELSHDLNDTVIDKSPYGEGIALTSLTNNAADIFPDWFSPESKGAGVRQDSGLHRRFGKVVISYDYTRCGERASEPRIKSSVDLIFPVHNAHEVSD